MDSEAGSRFPSCRCRREDGLEFDEVPEALRYVGEGLAHGKVVVTTD